MFRFIYSPTLTSESRESDLIAQQRWEGEGGNTGESRQLPVIKMDEVATYGTHSNSGNAVLTKRYRVLLHAVRQARIF